MHPGEELLSALFDDELSLSQNARVAAHLAGCGRCQGVLRGYAALGTALRRSEVDPPASLHADLHRLLSGGRTWLGVWSRVGVAASMALVALLAYAFFLVPPSEPATVAMAYPRRDATSVPLDTVVQIVYSADVDRSAVEQAVQIEPPVAVLKSWRGDTLVLEPREPLKPDTTYSVRAPGIAPAKPAQVPPAEPAQQTLAVPTPQVVTQFRTAPVAVAVATAKLSPVTASPVASGPTLEPTRLAVAAAASQSPSPIAVGSTPEPTRIAIAAAQATPTRSSTPANPAGTRAATPKPSPSPDREPARGFGLLYGQPEIAAALGRPNTDDHQVRLLEQRFEGGWLLWRSDQLRGDERTFYVLTDDGKWRAYTDDGVEVDDTATPAADLPIGMSAPRRTLGKLWLQREDVRRALGWATETERQLNGNMQTFAKGAMLGLDRQQIYVLYEDGRWQRLPDPYVEPTATPSSTPTVGPAGAKASTPLPGAGLVPGGRTCLIAPQRSFALVYANNEALRVRLACALEPEAPVQLVEQPFENGTMLARADKGLVYVLLVDGTWSAFADAYQAGETVAAEHPSAGLQAPERALGAVWQDYVDVRRALGWATAPERTYAGVGEGFVGGNLLAADAGHITAIYSDGRWERLPE